MLMLLSENDLSDNQEDKNKTSETNQTRDTRTPSIKHYLQALLHSTMTKEFVSLVLTLVVYYAMFVTSVTKTNKASPAQLFFTNSSCVQDYYDGNLGAAMKQAIQSEVSVILLYAPWDADSQFVRQEFDVTCRFYLKQVKFFAINCWQPGGQCRTHFSKLNRFPALLIYRRGSSLAEVSNVQFKGHWYADHLISFVMNVLNPISKIDSTEHLSRFKSNNDGLVVLCADLQSTRGARLYQIFHSVALKFLELDPYRDIKFAVVLNSRVSLYLTQVFPSLVLLNFNNSMNYKGNFTEGNIIEWILGSLGAKPVNWVNLSGTKSMTLNYYLKNETSLVLFTPRNLLRNMNLYYNLLKIIAADFTKNCHPFIYDTTDTPSSSLEEKQEHYQILINHLVVNSIVEAANDRILADTCDQLKMKIIEKIIARRKALEKGSALKRSLAEKEIKRMKAFANQTLDNQRGQSPDGNHFGSFVLNINKETGVLFPVSSSNVEDIFNVSSTITSSNFVSTVTNQSVDKSETFIDKFSIMNLLYENSKHMCKLLRVANRILRVPNIKDLLGQETDFSRSGELNSYTVESINEQARQLSPSTFTANWGNAFSNCATNKSLNFLSLDSKRYRYFLDNLNIDLSAYKDETLALIVDVVNNNENVYLLSANITRDSLVVFVKDYLGDRLTRYKRNNDFGHPSDPVEKVSSKNILSLNRKFDGVLINSTILELNAVNFQSITHNARSNVIVLFYSKYCGHCLPYSHVFLLLSHILSHIRELCFARIDVDTNDLSYPFVPAGIPGLLLFPAGHPENSASYDRSMPFSQTNLLSFLIREIPDSALGVHIYLVVCIKTNKGHAFECLSNVNKLLHTYISRYKVKVYKAYAHFPSSSFFASSRPPSLSSNLTMKIKKYLIRLKYFRSVQLFIRNHLIVSTVGKHRGTTARYVRHLYSVYQKCGGQIAHINKVYARLSEKRLHAPGLTWRVKEEL